MRASNVEKIRANVNLHLKYAENAAKNRAFVAMTAKNIRANVTKSR
jgi:hypothetical protein